MKFDWKEAPLSEIVSGVIDHRGLTPKKLGGDWADVGYRALSAKNVKTGKIVQPESIRFVSEDMYHRWMPEEIEENDILITSEAPFGEIYLWDSKEKIVLSQRLFGIKVSADFDPVFIYYYMLTDSFQGDMRSRATGTTVIGLRQPELLKCKVRFPRIEIQTKIGSVLRSIDQKIKINEVINDNLLQQLQTVYNLMFGKESQDGKPEGQLSDICAYSQRRVAVSSLSPESYYSTENMLPGKAGAVVASSLPSIAQTTGCMPGDVLISNIRPYFKKIVYSQSECGCSTDVLCFVPKTPDFSLFLFSTLYDDHFFVYMVAGSKGTKMPRGDKQQIMAYPVVLPSAAQLAEFNAVAQPILTKIEICNQENKRLASMRDILLPKLMSGELDVSDLEL